MPARRTPQWADQMNSHMTIEQALKTYDRALAAAERADSTRGAYQRAGKRFIAFLESEGVTSPKVTALTPDTVRRFLLWLREQPSIMVGGQVRSKGPRAMHSHVVALKAFAHFLLEHGVYKSDPLAGLKNPRVPKIEVHPFSRDEVRLLVAAIGDRPLATRNRALIYFMLASGCRASEVCGLKVADVDLKGGFAKVFGKGKKERIVQFDRSTAKHLAFWLAERPETSAGRGCVFVSMAGESLSAWGLYRIVRTLGDAAGIEHAHPHRLRHTMATTFLEAHPGSVFHLQALLGHTQLEMTRRYAKTASARAQLAGPSIIETLGLR